MVKKIIALLGAVLLCFSGCAVPEKEPTEMAEDTKAESDDTYKVSRHEVNGTKFYDVVRRDNRGKSPIVFFLHGLNGKKDEMFSYAKMLAYAGYVAVVPDCAGQGESTLETTLDFCQIMQKTALNCNDILDFYENSKIADNSQFAVSGLSMGGMTALYYGAYSDIRPSCVVSLFGTPNWESLLGVEQIYVECTNGVFTAIEDQERRKNLIISMIEQNPENNMENLLQIPVLMINGDKDELIPVEGIKSFLVKAELFQNQLESIIRKERIHDIGYGDPEKMVMFISEYMPSGQEKAQEQMEKIIKEKERK